MNIGVCKIRLHLPGNRDLKGKRRVIASMRQRVRDRFGVAIAEVADNDSWQTATLGIACVSSGVRHADEVVDNVIAHIEGAGYDVLVVDVDRQMLTGF